MDIEALVARITQEVMQQLDSRSDDPRVPPPARHPQSAARSDKTCYKRATGECAGVGCCAELIPQDVRAIVHSGAERVGNLLGGRVVHSELARLIDHTLLKPDATRDQVMLLCQEARENLFASVCINPSWVALCAEQLRGSGVKVCTVVGFPLGATTTVTKVMETRDAVANGADEIDMVVNVAALKDGQDGFVEQDIREVVGAASGRIVKVILETALLSDEEVVRGCHLSKRAGADFVKTSTGFGPGGATSHHVALMRKTVGPTMGVKASGGIRDLETAQEMVKAGATRIGASASVKIVRGEKGTGTY